jgi:hypothetical protein
MKFIKEHKVLLILGSIPVVLFLIYKLLLSFKGTTLLVLTLLTFFSFKMDHISIQDVSARNPQQPSWLACYAEKNYWSKYEKQSIFAYEIDKSNSDYEQKISNLKNEVINKTSTLGRNNVIELQNKIIYTYHQYFIPLVQAEKYEAYPLTLRKEWDDQKTYLNYGYEIISVDEYCDILIN